MKQEFCLFYFEFEIEIYVENLMNERIKSLKIYYSYLFVPNWGKNVCTEAKTRKNS